jgi:hypothetical protein
MHNSRAQKTNAKDVVPCRGKAQQDDNKCEMMYMIRHPRMDDYNLISSMVGD